MVQFAAGLFIFMVLWPIIDKILAAIITSSATALLDNKKKDEK